MRFLNRETCSWNGRPKGVQKDRGLEALVEYLGIDASQVMACGDEANDASMLKWAGLGIAMANAVDDVKEIAL